MNIVIYVRYSSSGQFEQNIEGQLKVCYEFAKRNGYKVIGEYIDRALTGTSDNRPEFQRMIADSAKRQFQAVLVYQLDRFARNRYDSATYINAEKCLCTGGNVALGYKVDENKRFVIDDDTFAEVQAMMQKNKKAPARAKAVEDNYILTTKIFCAHCQAAIVGVSGTRCILMSENIDMLIFC